MNADFLAIDCGNSRVKGTLFDCHGAVIERSIFPPAEVESLLELIESSGVSRVAMASVGHIDSRMVETLGNLLDEDFMLFTPASDAGLEIAYQTPRTLGIDRKLTACGAAALFPGETLLVADAGTALTLDLVEGSKRFIGGNISPGLRLRFLALHENTALLPMLEVEAESAAPEAFGSSTANAIFAGVAGGLMDEICCSALRACRRGANSMLLCGGDAPYLAKHLPERLKELEIDMEIVFEPDLLAIGLREAYTYIRHHENL